MANQKGTTVPAYYTAAQAVKRSRITPVVFAWLVHTEGITLPRIGNRAVYTDDTIRQVLAAFRARDPEGRFLCRRKRKNGPQARPRGQSAGQAALEN